MRNNIIIENGVNLKSKSMPGIYLKPLTTYRLEQNKDQSLITRSILQNDLIIINNKEQENNLIAIGFFK